jgi:hypothetical protein
MAVKMQCERCPGRAGRKLNRTEIGGAGQDISTQTPIWPLFYSLSTPVLAHSPLPNAIMPAHRHPSTARSHTQGRQGRPYKASIIVISSDEEEEPVPVPKRGPRRPRRSRAEGEVLEISDNTSVKVEEPELDGLRQRCHELEQACSPHCTMNPPSKRDSPRPNFLGARHVAERQ